VYNQSQITVIFRKSFNLTLKTETQKNIQTRVLKTVFLGKKTFHKFLSSLILADFLEVFGFGNLSHHGYDNWVAQG